MINNRLWEKRVIFWLVIRTVLNEMPPEAGCTKSKNLIRCTG